MPAKDAKNESPPSTLTAMGRGLDITEGSGPLEKYGPGTFGFLYVVALFLPAFIEIPNQTAYSIALGVVAPLGAGWIVKLGSSTR